MCLAEVLKLCEWVGSSLCSPGTGSLPIMYPRDVRLSHAAESKNSCALFSESHTPAFLSASCAMSSDGTAGLRCTVCLTICTCEATSAVHGFQTDAPVTVASWSTSHPGSLQNMRICSAIHHLFHSNRIPCHLHLPKLVAFVWAWRGDVLSTWSKRNTLSRASRASKVRFNI